MKIFCFNPAGGNVTFWDELRRYIPEHEMITYDYPGHGSRKREPLCEDIDVIISEIVDEIYRSCRDSDEYVLAGYSMGSIVAVATLKRIIDDKRIEAPQRLLLFAHSPRIGRKDLIDEKEKDQYIKCRILELGGIPDDLINNPIFWRVCFPLYRNDFYMMWNYNMEKLRGVFKIPLSVFYSQQDIPLEEILEWNDFFLGENDYYNYPGGHFFLKKNYLDISKVIGMILR